MSPGKHMHFEPRRYYIVIIATAVLHKLLKQHGCPDPLVELIENLNGKLSVYFNYKEPAQNPESKQAKKCFMMSLTLRRSS